MAHCPVLATRQRSAMFDLPADEASHLKHYILADDDLEHIRARRRTENRIGFAHQPVRRHARALPGHGIVRARLQQVPLQPVEGRLHRRIVRARNPPVPI